MRITVTTQTDIAYLQKYLREIGESLQIGSTIVISTDGNRAGSSRESVQEQIRLFQEISALFPSDSRASMAQKLGVLPGNLSMYCNGRARLTPKTLKKFMQCPELQVREDLMARLQKHVWRKPRIMP